MITPNPLPKKAPLNFQDVAAASSEPSAPSAPSVPAVAVEEVGGCRALGFPVTPKTEA